MRPVARTSLALCALVLAGTLAACRGESTPPAAPSSAPGAGGAPAAPAPASTGDGRADEVRLLLLRSLFGPGARLPDPGDASPAADASAIALRYPDRELWLAATSGAHVFDIPGDHRQVAALYEHRASGGWVEIARRPLESAPVATRPHQLAAGGSDSAWIAVTGNTATGGGTYEVLRFDGKALSSALWWYSPLAPAAHEIDLDGDGIPEIVLDASDPALLCAGCGVVDISEVIYRWQGGDLVPVQLTTVGSGPAALSAGRAVLLANAGLWRDAMAAIAVARAAATDRADVQWTAIAINRIATARLAQAGAVAQPLLTDVLAGEYAAAAGRMRGLDPAEAFAPDGPLIARTAAARAPKAMGQALVDAATRATAVQGTLADAYLVRALGRLLVDPKDFAGALADANRAAAAAPNDAFARASVAFLTARSAAR